MQEDFTRTKLAWPSGENKVLLHSCCAPCSGKRIEPERGSRIMPDQLALPWAYLPIEQSFQ